MPGILRSLPKEVYLRIQDFDYQLPADCIATRPASSRDASRLLVLDAPSGQRSHAVFRDLPRLLRPRSLVVLNDTQVMPARLAARKSTGGAVEVLLVRKLEASGGVPWEETWEVLARSLGPLPPGGSLALDGGVVAEIVARGERGAARMRFRGEGQGGLLAHAERAGVVPLPPYIESARKRGDAPPVPAAEDRERYQTVYARVPGAVAAPTAGLHFTRPLLDQLVAAGHEIATLTLHVGPGTFRPVEVEDPAAHRLDPEIFDLPAATAAAIRRAQAEGRPVVAVGTTVVRALETVAAAGEVQAGGGATELFLLPGCRFRVVTDLVTNFHLPRSTLLMLVAAFAGREAVMAAYADAVASGYRFYSYGDAMLITRGAGAPP
jgi:S-adenosylmethionine:tRNA ribosyltransferase-isomerase